jgi:small ligand-binding sensory domain FIST
MNHNSTAAALIGTSKHPDSTQAAQQAARMILNQLEPSESVGWGLAFCGGRHDQEAILHTLHAYLGPAQIVGGSAVGTITNNSLGYSGYECSLAAFPAGLAKPTILAMDGLNTGEFEVGRQLGAKLEEVAHEGDTVLLFYDSIRSGPPPVLYIGSQLMDGLYEGLPNKQLKLIGAGTIRDLQMSGSYVFNGYQGAKHSIVAAVLPSAIQSHTTIMHGCIPVSSFLKITKIEGSVLYEIEGRPALEVLLELVGQSGDPSILDNLSLSITIGKKHGRLFTPYDESAYVNRLILSSNPADGSVTLFDADFQVGTKIQVMSRDNFLMLESTQKRTKDLLASLNGEKPIFALYIDCAGRSSGFSGAEAEEASMVQTALGQNVPLLGFYSGVEIAPLLGRSRPLDWTGVLTVFTIKN